MRRRRAPCGRRLSPTRCSARLFSCAGCETGCQYRSWVISGARPINVGPKKSAEDWSPRSNSAHVAASKPLRNGQGRTIGAVTVTKLLVCLAYCFEFVFAPRVDKGTLAYGLDSVSVARHKYWTANVRFGSLADISLRLTHVRLTSENRLQSAR